VPELGAVIGRPRTLIDKLDIAGRSAELLRVRRSPRRPCLD
jgi:hypothetical protein